jgi:hypothetical protein
MSGPVARRFTPAIFLSRSDTFNIARPWW